MFQRDNSMRILVVRALQLGDLLCAVPALTALRRWMPAAEITLCGLPWSSWMVDRYSHLLDKHIEFPGYPGIPEVEFKTQRWNEFQQCNRGRFDLAIQLHGSGTYINDFVRALEAQKTAGFHPVSHPELALDHSIPWPDSGHEIERLKEVVLSLGADDCSNKLELPIQDSEIFQARELLAACGLPSQQPYVCLHVGGRSLTRRWPIERYQTIAKALTECGLWVVLTGTNEERSLCEELSQALPVQCINLAGRTSLGQVIGLIDQASLLLSNDTGVSHIAAARQTPSVILGLGSDLARWLPLNRQLHSPVYIDVPCRPCYAPTCPTQFECARGIEPTAVWQAIETHLPAARAGWQSSHETQHGRESVLTDTTETLPLLNLLQ